MKGINDQVDYSKKFKLFEVQAGWKEKDMSINYEFDGKKILEVTELKKEFELNNYTHIKSPIDYVLDPLDPKPTTPQASLDTAQLSRIRQDLMDLKSTLLTIQEQCFQVSRMITKIEEKIK